MPGAVVVVVVCFVGPKLRTKDPTIVPDMVAYVSLILIAEGVRGKIII